MTNTSTQQQHNQTTQAEALASMLVGLMAVVLFFVLCLTWWQAEEINRLRGDLRQANNVIETYRQHQDGNQQQAPEQQRGRLRNIGDQVAAFERQTLEAREELKK